MAADGIWLRVPDAVRDRVSAFMLDGRTGKVLLNIRDGQILKAVLEEHI